MNLIDKYLVENIVDEEVKGLTKPIIFKKVMSIIGNDWMDIDQISVKAKLPISKHGLGAHILELVNKGKLKESMKKGKYIWRKV